MSSPTANGVRGEVLSTGSLEKIAAHGDVILKVGEDVGYEPAQMLVSSAVLSMASRSFAALLGPRFLEGQQKRNPGQPATIRLPDDGSKAMSDMCNLLHLRDVPDLQVCEPERILALAVVIDKYCCVEALRLAAQGLLHDALEDDKGQKDAAYTIQIATAAYLLDQQRAFAKATRLMFEYCTTQLSQLRKTKSARLFPLDALLALEERRSLFFERIGNKLAVDSDLWCYSCRQSRISEAYTTFVSDSFNEASWPPPFLTKQMPVRGVIQYMLDFENFEYDAIGCSLDGQCVSYANQKLEHVKRLALLWCKGLCLRCVKDDCLELCAPDVPRLAFGRHDNSHLCKAATHRTGPRLRVQ